MPHECGPVPASSASAMMVCCVMQEPSAADAVSLLSALGASGQVDGRLQLHSVLAGEKRRVTAEIGQAVADHDRGAPLLQLTKVTAASPKNS